MSNVNDIKTGRANITSKLGIVLKQWPETYRVLLNDPQSNIEGYNTLLTILNQTVYTHRVILNNEGHCKCKIPTIASYLLNIGYSRAMLSDILRSSTIFIFPERIRCICYDHIYARYISYIMAASPYVWKFDPKRFPKLNISALPEIGTEKAKSWMQKYKHSISREIELEGKNSGIYHLWLIEGTNKPKWDVGYGYSPLIGLTFDEFLFAQREIIKDPFITLDCIWNFLFRRQRCGSIAFCTVERTALIFRVLEYLATQIDFRHLMISMRLDWCRKNEDKIRFDWIDLYCENNPDHSFTRTSALIKVKEIMDLGYTRERFLQICSDSHKNWSPNTHNSCVYSTRFRKQAFTLLLIRNRIGWRFPKDVAIMIIRYMAFNDAEMRDRAVKDPNFREYYFQSTGIAYEQARYSLQLCPYVYREPGPIIDTILVENGEVNGCDSREDFIANICDEKSRLATSKISVNIWRDVFSHYGIKKSLIGLELADARDTIREGCKEILNNLLDEDGVVPYNFVDTGKRSGRRWKKQQTATKQRRNANRERERAKRSREEMEKAEDIDGHEMEIEEQGNGTGLTATQMWKNAVRENTELKRREENEEK